MSGRARVAYNVINDVEVELRIVECSQNEEFVAEEIEVVKKGTYAGVRWL